jgi:Tat protein translocase TatB subunit
MFGVGYQEMFVILVIALVVFGPQRLPELAGQAGRWIREFRNMTAGLTGEFEKTMAEVDDIRDTVRREMKSMMDEVDDVADGVKRDLGAPGKNRAGTAKSKTARGPAQDRAKPGNQRKPAAKALPVATKQDPLSDVSALDDDLLTGPIVKKPSVNGNGNGAGQTEPDLPAVDDALVRVRQRRASAPYSKRY